MGTATKSKRGTVKSSKAKKGAAKGSKAKETTVGLLPRRPSILISFRIYEEDYALLEQEAHSMGCFRSMSEYYRHKLGVSDAAAPQETSYQEPG